jgi:hypothetical protein
LTADSGGGQADNLITHARIQRVMEQEVSSE